MQKERIEYLFIALGHKLLTPYANFEKGLRLIINLYEVGKK